MPMPEVNKYAGTYRKALTENPDNQELNTSIAMCYLKLKLYDKALPSFEKALEDNFDNSETFFYAAICLLRGQKAFMAQRADIDKIVEYVNAALMIEPRGIYYYFLAYIKYDYFHRKYLNTAPNYQETLRTARDTGVSNNDVQQLFLILGVEVPASLNF
jgi:tetratricopeptide (TPR) repeat protein